MENDKPRNRKVEIDLAWQDGYNVGLDLDDKEKCPIDETDDELFQAWRAGWLAAKEWLRGEAEKHSS